MKNIIFLLILLPHLTLAAGLDFEAVFNEPGLDGKATTTLEDKFQELLDKAPAGSEVLLNVYGLRMPHVAEAIVKAQARGVRIGVLLRNFKDELSATSVGILKTGLKQCSFGKCLKICGLACSAPGYNHNKFMLFSELSDGSRNVMVHTSNNFWPDERNNFNDFLIIRNNERLYQGMRQYWLTLYRGKANPGLPPEIAEGVKLHLFPKAMVVVGRRKIDPIRNILERVQCVPGASVTIAHSRFTDPRSAIADELARLQREGCAVKLLIKNDLGHEKAGPFRVVGDSPGPAVIRKLGDILHLFPYEEPIEGKSHAEGDPKRNALHSKIMLINAPMQGNKEFRKLVLVGTHNLDVPSLKLNNELLLEIADDHLFDAYESAVQRLLGQFLALPPEKRVACPGLGCAL